jgi:hypothetical protein
LVCTQDALFLHLHLTISSCNHVTVGCTYKLPKQKQSAQVLAQIKAMQTESETDKSFPGTRILQTQITHPNVLCITQKIKMLG